MCMYISIKSKQSNLETLDTARKFVGGFYRSVGKMYAVQKLKQNVSLELNPKSKFLIDIIMQYHREFIANRMRLCNLWSTFTLWAF
jgi:hypothetical protein